MRSRRSFLSAIAAAGLAGCLGSDSSDDSTETATPTETAPTRSETTQASSSTPAGEETSAEITPIPTQADPSVFPGYETTDVAIETPVGERVGTVTTALARTSDEWSVGLSETASMPVDYGMLFVSNSVSDQTFWMLDMDFGLDILFVDDQHVITTVHHAPAPGPDESGADQQYSGRGQYVLEVNYRWTAHRGIEEGDVLVFDL